GTPAASRNAFGSLAQNRSDQTPRRRTRRAAQACPHTALVVRVHWPPTRNDGGRAGAQAPRRRGLARSPASDQNQPIPVPATASVSTPRARAHAAAVARTRLRYLVRLPGQESRGRDFRGRRAPRRCPTTRGKIYEAWCSRVPVGRSQRHAPGRSSFPSLSDKPPMGNAMPWPVRRHVAIASANCMPWRILMCPTRI
ncbi:hypothetical protein PVAP13_1NG481719, partial [Panicum virgatum]